MENKSKETLCIHSDTIKVNHQEVNNSIHTSTSYTYLDDETRIYPRNFNTPNQQIVAQKIADLENAETGIAYSSGMAAISAALMTYLKPGDHIIIPKGLYGGSKSFIEKELTQWNIEYTIADNYSLKSFEDAIQKNTKVIYIESPTNPLLNIIDLKMVADLCHEKNIISMIDNTFATPVAQNPIDYGIDIVIHSATKYLGGHSDICAGATVASKKHIDKIMKTSRGFGGVLNPFMCHLLERSIKTLSIRIEKQNNNAQILAEYLQKHDAVEKVFYPGLSNHPGHEIASRQMRGYGSVVSFELKNKDTDKFQKNLHIIQPVLSLGGIESTICAPSLTSHKFLSKEARENEGIKDNLLRLSVGIEGINDLKKDIENAIIHS